MNVSWLFSVASALLHCRPALASIRYAQKLHALEKKCPACRAYRELHTPPKNQ
jgi:hypothetical protein